jgi:hypothetical protein
VDIIQPSFGPARLLAAAVDKSSTRRRLQKLRKDNPKGTILNLLYKEMGNSIYGNVVRGISNKKSFDTLTGKSFWVTGTDL